jgi:hypothetical protein
MNEENKTGKAEEVEKRSSAPLTSLPKGGGAINGIAEKFAANPVTGTGSLSVPVHRLLNENMFSFPYKLR